MQIANPKALQLHNKVFMYKTLYTFIDCIDN